MAIINAQLKTSSLDIIDPISGLGVPVGKSYAITNILVCNTGSADASFDMHLIPNGTSENIKVTRVINNLTLPGGETFTFDNERIILDAGDAIVFKAIPDIGAALTDLAATVSYLEV
jgi:hypothetical protein|tara:strand:+ start:1050 stop:1400 length:351 start_codon:yes stop_codon:yes gene_type:complete